MGIKSGKGKQGGVGWLGWLAFFDGAKKNRKSSPTDKSV